MVTVTFRHSDGHTAASLAPLKCKHWAVSYANNLKVEAGGWERPRGGLMEVTGEELMKDWRRPHRAAVELYIYYLLSLIF